MKTTSLYPIIVTENVQETIDFYVGTLDYYKKHDMDLGASRIIVLENPKGCTIEVMQKPTAAVPGLNFGDGLYGFRMNVDDIDEAVAEFRQKGAKILMGPIETPTSKNLMVLDPNGIHLTVMEHKKAGRK